MGPQDTLIEIRDRIEALPDRLAALLASSPHAQAIPRDQGGRFLPGGSQAGRPGTQRDPVTNLLTHLFPQIARFVATVEKAAAVFALFQRPQVREIPAQRAAPTPRVDPFMAKLGEWSRQQAQQGGVSPSGAVSPPPPKAPIITPAPPQRLALPPPPRLMLPAPPGYKPPTIIPFTPKTPPPPRVGEPARTWGPQAKDWLPYRPPQTSLSSTEGWKLHLATDRLKEVSEILKAAGLQHKVGRSGGQEGKDITVYAGSFEKAMRAAKQIESLAAGMLKPPSGEVLRDDRSFTKNIMGRFDVGRSDLRFHQYGEKGVPWLAKDMDHWNRRPGATERADTLLRQSYGSFYKPTEMARPTTGAFYESEAKRYQAQFAQIMQSNRPTLGAALPKTPIPTAPAALSGAEPLARAINENTRQVRELTDKVSKLGAATGGDESDSSLRDTQQRKEPETTESTPVRQPFVSKLMGRVASPTKTPQHVPHSDSVMGKVASAALKLL